MKRAVAYKGFLRSGESIILLLPLSLLFQSGQLRLPETCVLFWRPEMRCQETLLMRMTTPLMPASIHTIHLILQWLVICLMFVNLFHQPSMKQALIEPPLEATPICTYAVKVQWWTCSYLMILTTLSTLYLGLIYLRPWWCRWNVGYMHQISIMASTFHICLFQSLEHWSHSQLSQYRGNVFIVNGKRKVLKSTIWVLFWKGSF